MPAGLETLNVMRISRVMRALQDEREKPKDLLFLGRTPLSPAVDGEIMARFVGRIQIADLIADDAKAAVYSMGKFSLESTSPPNLKVGKNLTQEQINQLYTIQAMGPNGAGVDTEVFGDFLNSIADNNLLGIRQRMETLLVAMHLDGFSYDRLGIKMQNVTWGMPSDLKVTPAVPWTDAANATPVNDVLGVLLVGKTRYGVTYNRMTMSTPSFRYMIATTEFQNKARTFLAPNVSYTNLSLLNLDQQKTIAEQVLGIGLEFYDSRYWSQDIDTGAQTSNPFLPVNKVILGSTSSDNNPAVQDFANGVVTESLVSGLLPNNGISGMVGSFGRPMRGPVGYSTVIPDLNPPNVTVWGVARGFPRKFVLQANAVLTVGTFSDQIPVGEPF